MSKASKPAKINDKNSNENTRKFEIAGAQDLPDTPRNEEEMKPESATIDIPDVKDIPGQEHVVPPPLGELADTTVASDDEEGVGIFVDDDDELEFAIGTEGDVTKEEKKDLQITDEDMPTKDDQSLRQASPDNVDDEGDNLNELGFGKDISGGDLDVPGSEEDDANEEIGEEDEENNPYSTGDNDTSETTQ